MALAGEVLGTCRKPAFRHAAHPRAAVARDELRVLAVGTDADVGAVAIGQHVEAGPEVQVDTEPPQLAGLEQSLLVGERLLARRAHREVVGEDRHAAPEHHAASALVVRGHEQSAAERALETAEKVEQLRRALEVAAIEDEPGRARVAEYPDVGVVERRARQADHEPLADEIFEARHAAILATTARFAGGSP